MTYETLLETLAEVPLEVWYRAALDANAGSERLPDVARLWRAADESDPLRTWEIADRVETLYYRLNVPAAVSAIGGQAGCRLLRRATELAVLTLAFPHLLAASDAARVAQPLVDLLPDRESSTRSTGVAVKVGSMK